LETFLDFRISQGSIATNCMWCENLCGFTVLCGIYMENFLLNHLVKEFWKSVHICQSYYQSSRDLLFGTQCINLRLFIS